MILLSQSFTSLPFFNTFDSVIIFQMPKDIPEMMIFEEKHIYLKFTMKCTIQHKFYWFSHLSSRQIGAGEFKYCNKIIV